MRRNFDWVHGNRFGHRGFCRSGSGHRCCLQWTLVPAYATGRRRNGRIAGYEADRPSRKRRSGRPNARREMIKAVRNVGRKSEIPSRIRASPPGT